MAAPSHHLPRRYILARLTGHPLAPLQRQHELGRNVERSDRHVLLQGGADDPEELPNDLYLVRCDGGDDDGVGRRRAGGEAGAVRLADHELCDHLATGKHCVMSLPIAACA